jgi:hypothetical protein
MWLDNVISSRFAGHRESFLVVLNAIPSSSGPPAFKALAGWFQFLPVEGLADTKSPQTDLDVLRLPLDADGASS